MANNFQTFPAPQNVGNNIEISLESNDMRGSLYHQLEKILRQNEIDFLELNNFIQSTQSGYERTNNVTDFQEKMEVKIGS